jgi:hypothetical protein
LYTLPPRKTSPRKPRPERPAPKPRPEELTKHFGAVGFVSFHVSGSSGEEGNSTGLGASWRPPECRKRGVLRRAWRIVSEVNAGEPNPDAADNGYWFHSDQVVIGSHDAACRYTDAGFLAMGRLLPAPNRAGMGHSNRHSREHLRLSLV